MLKIVLGQLFFISCRSNLIHCIPSTSRIESRNGLSWVNGVAMINFDKYDKWSGEIPQKKWPWKWTMLLKSNRRGTPEFCGNVTSGTQYWVVGGGVIDNLVRSWQQTIDAQFSQLNLFVSQTLRELQMLSPLHVNVNWIICFLWHCVVCYKILAF